MKQENKSITLRQYKVGNLIKSNYFYSRKEYAEKLMKSIGNSHAIVLFEGRRKGKTTFLINDLASIASNDHYVFYYSFMLEEKDLLNGNFKEDFIFKLNEFMNDVIFNEKNNDRIKKSEFEISLDLKNPLMFLNSFKVKYKRENISQEKIIRKLNLIDIFDLIKEFTDKKVLLILDEFQEVARFQKNQEEKIGFIKDLRTGLDLNKTVIKTVFTGSSYNDLSKLFSNYNEPFYKFGFSTPLKSLDDDFVKHCLTVFENETGIKINLEDAIKIFKRMNGLPEDFINLLLYMELNDYKNIKDAYNEIHFLPSSDLDKMFLNLTEIEKEVLKIIYLKKGKGITNEENINRIKTFCKNEEINKNKIKNTVSKLKDKNLIVRKINSHNWELANYELIKFVEKIIV